MGEDPEGALALGKVNPFILYLAQYRGSPPPASSQYPEAWLPSRNHICLE